MSLASCRFLSGGFRPFFLFGAVHAALMIGLWGPWFLGFMHVPSAFSPVVWHQHELLFGFVPAIIAGFLLTAVPNWTGRPTLKGAPLLALVLLWLAGRIATATSETIGLTAAAATSLLFLPVLVFLILRELVAGKNRRNYKVAAILALLFAAQVLFFREYVRFGRIELASRMAIATVIFLIAAIGGRIIPTFTGNWLRKNNPGREPPPFGTFDLAAMGVSALALILWIAAARTEALAPFAGMACLAAGLFHFARQLRWKPFRTRREPLVTMLHVAFTFVPLGFLLTGVGLLTDDVGLTTAGLHGWTAGGIGAMTLAVMTRATRGHSGQALTAPLSTVLIIYTPIVLATLARIGAALLPGATMLLLPLAALGWIVAFLGYAGLYGPLILRK